MEYFEQKIKIDKKETVHIPDWIKEWFYANSLRAHYTDKSETHFTGIKLFDAPIRFN